MCYISIKDELDLHGGQVLKPSLQHKSKFLLGVCNENTFNLTIQTFHYGNDFFFFKSKNCPLTRLGCSNVLRHLRSRKKKISNRYLTKLSRLAPQSGKRRDTKLDV